MLITVASISISVVILMCASLTPYLFFQRNTSCLQMRRFSSVLLSFCNCFACGVFLATCFLGMIPHTKMHEQTLRGILYSNAQNSSSLVGENGRFSIGRTLLNANLMVLVGFLLMVLLEQLFSAFYSSRQKSFNNHMPLSQSTLLFEDNNKEVMSLQLKNAFYSKKNLKGNEALRTKNKNDCGNGKETSHRSLSGDSEPLVTFTDDPLDDSSVVSADDVCCNSSDDDGSIQFRSCHDTSKFNKYTGAGLSGTLQLIMLLFAMSIHSIFEGIALGAQRTSAQFFKILFSIMLHEVLCSFSYGISLSKQNVPLKSAVLSALMLSSSIPIGMLIMSVLGSVEGPIPMVLRFMFEGFAAGIFIHVACVEMLASEFVRQNGSVELNHFENGTGNHIGFDSNIDLSPSKWRGVCKSLVVCFGAFIAFLVDISIKSI